MRYRGERPKILAGLGSDELVTAPTGARPLTGAQRLMLAVLADALGCLVTTRRGHGRVACACTGCAGRALPARAGRPLACTDARRVEVLAWFQSEADTLFSFIGICQAVGLDPDAIRSQQAREGWPGIRRLHRSALLHGRESHGYGRRD